MWQLRIFSLAMALSLTQLSLSFHLFPRIVCRSTRPGTASHLVRIVRLSLSIPEGLTRDTSKTIVSTVVRALSSSTGENVDVDMRTDPLTLNCSAIATNAWEQKSSLRISPWLAYVAPRVGPRVLMTIRRRVVVAMVGPPYCRSGK